MLFLRERVIWFMNCFDGGLCRLVLVWCIGVGVVLIDWCVLRLVVGFYFLYWCIGWKFEWV